MCGWSSALERVIEGELTALGLSEEFFCVGGVFGGNQDLDGAESVEGQAVGFAERLPLHEGRDVVRREEGPHLGFLDLALGRENDHRIFHGIMVTLSSGDVASQKRRDPRATPRSY